VQGALFVPRAVEEDEYVAPMGRNG